jgi:UDP-3-O-[3-hydroxymyristoyl] N-acetylglucosamine deacetylase
MIDSPRRETPPNLTLLRVQRQACGFGAQARSGVTGAHMDGLPESLKPVVMATCQHTLKSAIGCVGVGLHTGRRVALSLQPAAPDTGIIFRRTDLGIDIPARFDRVADTRLCTMLASPDHLDARIGTVEHLMAAFAGAGVDNAVVAVDGPELPVLDGSAAPFLFLIDCAGVVEQSASRTLIDIVRPVRVEDGQAFAELRPGSGGLHLSVSIDFEAKAIGRQALSLHLTERSFRDELAQARTFAQLHEIDALKAAGLALGGSLQNALVVDGPRLVNPEGLRIDHEFVRHKLLDAVGDLALAGGALQGRFVAHRAGHALNNRLLRAVFADAANWRMGQLEPMGRTSYAYGTRAAA